MILHVTWDITPLSPPVPNRHCPGCAAPRPHHCTGKVRLNANGGRLDAWLIYRCASCDRTWNLPILERVTRASLSAADLAALHHSDAALVRQHAWNLAALARHCIRVDPGTTGIGKRLDSPWAEDWTDLRLTLRPCGGSALRLDRLLSTELCLSRAALHGLAETGALSSPVPLRRPVQRTVILSLSAHDLTEPQRRTVSAGLLDLSSPPDG